MERRERGAKYVLDASAFINAQVPLLSSLYTTPQVLNELKSEKRLVAESLIREGALTVLEPEKTYVWEVERVAKRTGDYEMLSEADKSVLALALQLGAVLVTDDFHVQNVAAILGIPVQGEVRIRRVLRWVRKCRNCGAEYPPDTKGRCPRCGGLLILVPRTLS